MAFGRRTSDGSSKNLERHAWLIGSLLVLVSVWVDLLVLSLMKAWLSLSHLIGSGILVILSRRAPAYPLILWAWVILGISRKLEAQISTRAS